MIHFELRGFLELRWLPNLWQSLFIDSDKKKEEKTFSKALLSCLSFIMNKGIIFFIIVGMLKMLVIYKDVENSYGRVVFTTTLDF